MNRKFVTLGAVVAAAALTACSNTAAPSNGATVAKHASAEDPNTVVATVNGEKVTLAELDKSMGGRMRQLEQQVREQKHQLRQAGLEAMVAKKLVEAEAKKRGLTEEQLLKAEVEDKVPAPSETEIRALYTESEARGVPGLPPYEVAKEQIAQFLSANAQRGTMMAFLESLKADAKVELLLAEPAAPKVDVAATGPSKGPKNAPITIVTFSDFECPFCSRVNPTLDELMKTYEGKIRVVFRDYPLPFHANAPKAAEAGHCADEQGKFWPMHDAMFANQKALGVEDLKRYAGEVGVDQAKFDACLDSGKMAEVVQKNMEEGEEAGVQGTPAFFVNGTALSGALPVEEFKKVIDAELGLGATASK